MRCSAAACARKVSLLKWRHEDEEAEEEFCVCVCVFFL